nr:MAG TPA: Protein of unknown function (DUF2846) [Caudoviricetes sp.]
MTPTGWSTAYGTGALRLPSAAHITENSKEPGPRPRPLKPPRIEHLYHFQGVNAMKITVMQVNNELASTGVSVYVDGQLLGSIGPGGSVSASLEAPSCLVRVECGVYSRELILWQDSALQVSWGLNPPEMIVSHAKK